MRVTRGWIAAVTVLLGTALAAVLVITLSAHHATSTTPDSPHRYADYLDPSSSTSSDDQCDKPVAERVGGWLCSTPTPPGIDH